MPSLDGNTQVEEANGEVECTAEEDVAQLAKIPKLLWRSARICVFVYDEK